MPALTPTRGLVEYAGISLLPQPGALACLSLLGDPSVSGLESEGERGLDWLVRDIEPAPEWQVTDLVSGRRLDFVWPSKPSCARTAMQSRPGPGGGTAPPGAPVSSWRTPRTRLEPAAATTATPQGERMATQTRFTAQATYADMESARRAIAALERSGIPGSDIKLEGPGAEEARDDTDQSDADEAFAAEATRSVLIGGAVGAAIGVVGGLIGGVIWLGGQGVYMASIAGLFGGGGLGFLVGAIARVQESEASELTYSDAEGEPVVVAVHTQSREDCETAMGQLRDTDPAPSDVRSRDQEDPPAEEG